MNSNLHKVGLKVKRIVILFTAVALSFMLSIMMVGCGGFGGLIFDSDTSVAAKKLDSLIECIEKKDDEGVKALFASNKLADIDDFNESIQELFDYYEGEFISHPNSTPGSMKDNDYGTVKEYFYIRNVVYTTSDTYYFTILWYIRDDTDKGNEGIWSLDVLRLEDAPSDNYLYCFTGSDWATGIHVGVISSDYYYDLFFNYLQEGNRNGLKSLFAANAIAETDNFDESLDELLLYYEGEYWYGNWKDSEFQSSRDKGEKIIFHNFGHNEVTTKHSYDFAFRWCSQDTADDGNIGLWSVYVRRYEYDEETYSETLRAPYWGDGLWTNGINIGVFE